MTTIKNELENSLERIYPLEKLSSGNFAEIKDNRDNINDTESDETKCKKYSVTKFNPFIGTLCMFLHTVFLQLIAVIVKKVSYISIPQLSLIRYTGTFVVSLPLAVFCTNQILGEKRSRRLLFLRSFLATTGLVFQIATFRYIQLVQASIVMSTLPFMTAVLARIVLKESFGIVQTVSLFATVCGVLLSIRLPLMLFDSNKFSFDVQHLIGYSLAFAFVSCVCISNVATRKLKQIHFSVILLYSGIIGIIENSALNAIFFPLVPAECDLDHILCVLLAIISFGANVFFIIALQREPAGLVMVQKSSFEILVMIIFQIIFFHKYPDWYAIGGACLVLISLAIIGIKNWVQLLPENSEKIQRLKWILS